MVRTLILGMLALLGLAQIAQAGNPCIALREAAQISGGYIRLGELADLSGDSDGTLARVFLGPAPELQQEKTIHRDEIRKRLRGLGLDAGVEFSGSEQVRVRCAAASESAPDVLSVAPAAATTVARSAPVVVTTPALPDQTATAAAIDTTIAPAEPRIPAAVPPVDVPAKPELTAATDPRELAKFEAVKPMFAKAVQAYLMQSLGIRNPAGVEIASDVTRCTLGETPAAVAEIEIEALRSGELPGHASANLILKDKNGALIGNGSADLTATLSVTVPILLRNLKQNEEVRPGDISLRTLRFRKGMPVNSVCEGEFAGLAAAQNLRSGSIVTAGDFQSALDVRKGQIISVNIAGNGFQVTEMASAGSDGRRGDTIAVEALVSKCVYRVRITGPGQADIPQSPVPAKPQAADAEKRIASSAQ